MSDLLPFTATSENKAPSGYRLHFGRFCIERSQCVRLFPLQYRPLRRGGDGEWVRPCVVKMTCSAREGRGGDGGLHSGV